jgi:alpha-beta hydrolase superfamily lysophospholipase
MSHHEEHFATPDGLSLYEQCWLPDAAASAVVVIVHGFIEHSGRYARLAEDLDRAGYAVYAMDLRGHGRSGGPRCFVRRFDCYLDDLDLFLDRVHGRQPEKPLFLFGHSMGALIVATWAIARGGGPDSSAIGAAEPQEELPDAANASCASGTPIAKLSGPPTNLRGLVLSGPAIRIGRGLFPLLRRLAWVLSLLAPRMPVVRVGARRLSRDPAVVEDFRNDPLVFHGRFAVRTGAEILAAMRSLGRDMEGLRLPLLILHGTGDRICDVAGSRQLDRRAASADKTLRLYDGLYHDLIHEPERAGVLADLLAWLEARRG